VSSCDSNRTVSLTSRVFCSNQESDSPHPPATPETPLSTTSLFNRRPRRIPTLLLLAMFAVSARYSTSNRVPPPPPDGSMMWAAGDDYLDSAKVILDNSYASSRSSTVQALLLMGYREIGIGAMARAWTNIGMAVRMAQDLGMHRSADGWARAGLGGMLFGPSELHERKRIWYGCVIMDKYVSTYIGEFVEGGFETFTDIGIFSRSTVDDIRMGL
jgi:Fungal specific transcription factor domain